MYRPKRVFSEDIKIQILESYRQFGGTVTKSVFKIDSRQLCRIRAEQGELSFLEKRALLIPSIIKKYVVDKLTTEQISKELNIGRQTVTNYLQKSGVLIRDNSGRTYKSYGHINCDGYIGATLPINKTGANNEQ